MDDQYRRLDVSKVGDVTVARLRDHKIIEGQNMQELGQEFLRLADATQPPKLLLNFGDVDFLSSAALGKLIVLDRKVRAQGGTLKLSNLRPEIHEIFVLTKLNLLFDIRGSEAEALAVF